MKMPKSIFLLTFASFATGTEAYVYTAHLQTLANDMGVSLVEAGQLASVFAITCAITAPIISNLTASVARKLTIALGLFFIGVLNIAAAYAASFEALVAIRIACGLAAGLVGPASSAFAAELAPPEKRAQAMALVLTGMTLAFILGIPTGSIVGDYFGWQGSFIYAGSIALLAGLLVTFAAPLKAVLDQRVIRLREIAVIKPLIVPLSLTILGFAATFSLIAYLGPVTQHITGASGHGIGFMQSMIGVGSIFGIIAGFRAAKNPSRRFIIVSFFITALSIGSASVLMLMPMHPALSQMIFALSIITGAAALFSRTPVIQTLLVQRAGAQRSVALALNSSAVFIGQGLGAVISGITISAFSISYLGMAGAVIGVIGICTVIAFVKSPQPHV